MKLHILQILNNTNTENFKWKNENKNNYMKQTQDRLMIILKFSGHDSKMKPNYTKLILRKNLDEVLSEKKCDEQLRKTIFKFIKK